MSCLEMTNKETSMSTIECHQSTTTSCEDCTVATEISQSSKEQIMSSEENAVLEIPGGSISDRLAALQRSGSENWKKRLGGRPVKKDDVLETPVMRVKEKSPSERPRSLLDRILQLGEAQDQWRTRVEGKDAIQFTVAGKMEHMQYSPHESPVLSRKKYTPKPVKIRSKTTDIHELKISNRQTLSYIPCGLSKSASTLISSSYSSEYENKEANQKVSHICVPQIDDETFSSFYKSVKDRVCKEKVIFDDEVFQFLTSEAHEMLSSNKKGIKVVRKHMSSKNPLRLLSSRTDLRQNYEEVYRGIAEKELERMKLERLAKSSTLALSALAGLASTEDFKNVALRRNSSVVSCASNSVTLLQVKGRRCAQVRLVQPLGISMNHGDSYVLVTPSQVFCWQGGFSNIIERAKASEVASLIQNSKDLGHKSQNEVILIDEEKEVNTEEQNMFFDALSMKMEDIRTAGSPEEDELYETAIVNTNAIYSVENEELVPYEKYCSCVPKIEMLVPEKAYVFDFGAEMYVWIGKLASPELRKTAVNLAKELWEQGYNYMECDINPLNATFDGPIKNQDNKRPDWTIFCKSTQHMEPVLFKAKFFDWPNMHSVIMQKKVIGEELKGSSNLCDLKPCDVKSMMELPEEPDLVLEGSHLGRGVEYYDKEEYRRYKITTISAKMWHILEYNYKLLSTSSWGQFHNCDTYVVRWHYMISNVGRTLHGTASRHSFVGRKRWVYFFWQGENSSINEKGASALMTVELNEEKGPHVRVTSGKEPPCFLSLFNGEMIVHRGRREEIENNSAITWRLFMLRGELKSEVQLFEVICYAKSLRSRTTFLLINVHLGLIYIWHGCKSSKHTREFALFAASQLIGRNPQEVGFKSGEKCVTEEIEEGSEPLEFWNGIGEKNRDSYVSLLNSDLSYEFTLRLFYITSVSGTLCAKEIVCPYFTKQHFCPFPILQMDLQNVSQPALFLIDNDHEVFMWQSWFLPENKEANNLATGSARVRWDINRRFALETVLQYCQAKNEKAPPRAFVVSAGAEPLSFTNLFPEWKEWDNIDSSVQQEKNNEICQLTTVQEVLSQLSRDRYTLKELQQQPLPEGINPLRMESYLIDSEFKEVLGMTKEEFYNLPSWKQSKIKQVNGLF